MSKSNQRTKTLQLTIAMAIVFFVLFVLGLLIPDDRIAGNFLNAGQAPSPEHPFGTDMLGRDMLMCTLKGLSVSIIIGIVASVISALLAVLIGMTALIGSKGMDALVNWLIDLAMSIPHTILVILISFVMGRGLKGLLVGIAVTHWCSLARLIRTEVLQLRSQQYIAISRKLGKSNSWILIHHLLPHLLPQIVVGMVLLFPHAILHEASVSFLGFGLPPEQPSIGMILAESMRSLSTGMWWSAVLPGLALVLIVLLIDKIGEKLRVMFVPYLIKD